METRSDELEILDKETPPREMMERVVGYLAFVNRWMGGTRAVARHFRDVKDPVTVLDVGAGGADIPRSLAKKFPHVRPMVLDLSEMMLSFAEGLPRVRGNALRLPFRDRSVDYVISSNFFHPLKDDQIVHALREFDRVARRGIVVNDLLRRMRALVVIKIFTLWANPICKSDGPISVKRGFLPAEIEGLARRAGLDWLKVELHFGERFTLAGERP
jgi:ubiquinone/menaquinone biosynthesis C-methylase UbiE